MCTRDMHELKLFKARKPCMQTSHLLLSSESNWRARGNSGVHYAAEETQHTSISHTAPRAYAARTFSTRRAPFGLQLAGKAGILIKDGQYTRQSRLLPAPIELLTTRHRRSDAN